MKISISSLTDIGLERENNEDACAYCLDLSRPQWVDKGSMSRYEPLSQSGALLLVADGMGGPNAGEVASSLAVESIRQSYSSIDKEKEDGAASDTDEFMAAAIRKADAVINGRIIDDISTAGMGTTIVLCWLKPEKAHIAWCGDSRCYLLRNGKLTMLTKDHSYVQELVDNGEITAEEAFSHPDSNIITRGLGEFDNEVAPEIVNVDIQAGDSFLLCSDGLCGYCTDEQISEIMAQHVASPSWQSEQLLKMALDSGGCDNISIVVAHVVGDDDELSEQKSGGFFSAIKKLFGC